MLPYLQFFAVIYYKLNHWQGPKPVFPVQQSYRNTNMARRNDVVCIAAVSAVTDLPPDCPQRTFSHIRPRDLTCGPTWHSPWVPRTATALTV
jgi:hypothetical protein